MVKKGPKRTTMAAQAARDLFREFIKIADTEYIIKFLATATTSPENENLKLLWDRALEEGYQIGYKEGQRDEYGDWIMDGHGSHCTGSPVIMLDDYGTPLEALEAPNFKTTKQQTATVDIATQTDSEYQFDKNQTDTIVITSYNNSSTQTEYFHQPPPENAPSFDVSTQTEPPAPIFDATSQTEPIPNCLDTSPCSLNPGNATSTKFWPFSPLSSENTSLLLRKTAYASPSLSSIDSELPLPANTTLFTENLSKNADFIENTPKTASSAILTSAGFDVTVRLDHSKSSPSSTVNPEAPASPETILFPQKHPKSPKTATSSPTTRQKLDVEARFDRARPSPHSTIVFQPSTAPKTTPFSQNTPKIPKNIENDPKTSKFATSSPQKLNVNVRFDDAGLPLTFPIISEASTPFVAPLFPENPPKINKNIENHPKSPKSAASSPESPPETILEPLQSSTIAETSENASKFIEKMARNDKFPISSPVSNKSFSWADEPCDLDPVRQPPTQKFGPRDLSVLSSGLNPWRSLQHQKGRQQRRYSNRRFPQQKNPFLSHPPHFNPFIHHQYRPSPPPIPHSLDWDQDPRLSDLSLALYALGWIRR